jgi:Glyoxalase/Bleomycin resistance protein/Dioxygenase superfamily
VLSHQPLFDVSFPYTEKVLSYAYTEKKERLMSQEAEKNAVISPTLHHFGVLTAHLEEMMNWYATVLGMTTIFQSTEAGIAFVSNDRPTTVWHCSRGLI